jgi:hypothetical protein
MNYTRKDLILLQKYKDENYKRALVDSVVSQVKHQVFQTAMNGDTVIRLSIRWASNQQEAEELQAQEALIRESLTTIFPDSKIEVETHSLHMILFEFWELVVKVNWGGYTT